MAIGFADFQLEAWKNNLTKIYVYTYEYMSAFMCVCCVCKAVRYLFVSHLNAIPSSSHYLLSIHSISSLRIMLIIFVFNGLFNITSIEFTCCKVTALESTQVSSISPKVVNYGKELHANTRS